jgi:hypothetical protein
LLLLTMVPITEAAVLHVARPILKRRTEKGRLSDFPALFGVSPSVCAKTWNLLLEDDVNAGNGKGFLVKHLLWGLMFLKSYGTSAALAKLAGFVCRETYMKWTWIAVKRVASLRSKVVSLNCS